jgi:hypothetical protein
MTSDTIAAHDHPHILEQAIQLAQKQKEILSTERDNLGDKTLNPTLLKWGVGQLALGTYLAAGLTKMYIMYKTNEGFADQLSYFLFPMAYLSESFQPGSIAYKLCNVTLVSQFFASFPVVPYCLYKSYNNIKTGLYYKQHLEHKITNLDAIISYLEQLQSTYHAS